LANPGSATDYRHHLIFPDVKHAVVR